MYYKPIQSVNDIKFDDRAVGILALVTMYQVVTFLLLQVLLFIPGSIILLLGENGVLDKETANSASTSIIVLAELSLIVWLVRRGKKSFLQEMTNVLAMDAYENSSGEDHPLPAFTETQLEIAVGLVATISIAWSMVFGVDSLALEIALTIIEAFAFIFLITFMSVRFMTTGEIRRTAVYCLILTAMSLWMLTQGV